MYKNLISSIIVAIVTMVITFVFQTLINSFFQSNMQIVICPPINIKGEVYKSLNLNNYSDEVRNDVKFYVPASTNISDIISSNPISIKIQSNISPTNLSKILIVSDIKPNETTNLLIPVDHISNNVELFNKKNIDLIFFDKIESPFLRAVKPAFYNAIVYGIIASILMYYTKQKTESMKNHAEEIRVKSEKDYEKLTKELEVFKDKSEKETNTLRKSAFKQRALLHLKLRDYEKELSFWRNMIRSLFFDAQKKSYKNADEIILKITEELKTYSTMEKNKIDFETSILYASWVKDNEENT